MYPSWSQVGGGRKFNERFNIFLKRILFHFIYPYLWYTVSICVHVFMLYMISVPFSPNLSFSLLPSLRLHLCYIPFILLFPCQFLFTYFSHSQVEWNIHCTTLFTRTNVDIGSFVTLFQIDDITGTVYKMITLLSNTVRINSMVIFCIPISYVALRETFLTQWDPPVIA